MNNKITIELTSKYFNADLINVIRCENCKHYLDHSHCCELFSFDEDEPDLKFTFSPKDYCSYGAKYESE